MMRYLMLLLIFVIAFSVGCAKPYIVGTPIEKARVDQIVPGTTQEYKVIEMFGQPAKKEMTGAGETKYVYSYYEEMPRFWSKNIQHKRTFEVFTKGGVVQKYNFKREGIDSTAAQ